METSLTRMKVGVIQRESLVGCSLGGTWVEKKNIFEFGKSINTILQQRMDYDSGVILEKNSFSFV